MKKIFTAILLAAAVLLAASCGLKELGLPQPAVPQNLRVNPDWSAYQTHYTRSALPDYDSYPARGEQLLYAVRDMKGNILDYANVNPYAIPEGNEGNADYIPTWKTHLFEKNDKDYVGEYEIIVSPHLAVADGKLYDWYCTSDPQPYGDLEYTMTLFSLQIKITADLKDLPLLDEHKNMEVLDNYGCYAPDYGIVKTNVPSATDEDSEFAVTVPVERGYVNCLNVQNDFSNAVTPSGLYPHYWGLFAGLKKYTDPETLELRDPCIVPNILYDEVFFLGMDEKVYYYEFLDLIYYNRSFSKAVVRLCKRYDVTDQIKGILEEGYGYFSVDPIEFSNDDMEILLTENGIQNFSEEHDYPILKNLD